MAEGLDPNSDEVYGGGHSGRVVYTFEAGVGGNGGGGSGGSSFSCPGGPDGYPCSAGHVSQNLSQQVADNAERRAGDARDLAQSSPPFDNYKWRAYVCGPMRGKPDFNYPVFNQVSEELEKLGISVRNPASNFGGDSSRDYSEYMRLDIGMVLDSNVLVLLPGWENSDGAKLEISLAKALKLDFWEARKDISTGTPEGWVFFPIDEPVPPTAAGETPRAASLKRSLKYITADRNNSYGPPTQDFERTAKLWTDVGFTFNGQPIKGHQIAMAMMLLKISRLTWQPTKMDSWDDTSGYSACGWENVVAENPDLDL
jgi:hypothetical protein